MFSFYKRENKKFKTCLNDIYCLGYRRDNREIVVVTPDVSDVAENATTLTVRVYYMTSDMYQWQVGDNYTYLANPTIEKLYPRDHFVTYV